MSERLHSALLDSAVHETRKRQSVATASDAVLFSLHVDRIYFEAAEADRLATMLYRIGLGEDNWNKYNLGASERRLRDAADKIKAIRESIERQQSEDHHEPVQAS